MAATIKMVAEYAGVSVATVSKYINGGNVYEENRIKVQKAIEDLDYRVNAVARSLKTSKTYTVGVLAPNILSGFLTSIICRIQTILMKHGYSTIIADYQEDKELEKKQLEMLLQKHIDGIIMFPQENEIAIMNMIKKYGIPLVLVNNIIEGSHEDAVLTDNVGGAYAAIEELIKHNHKRIGFVNGLDVMSSFKERAKGYFRAFEDYSIQVDDSLIVRGLHTIQAGYEGTLRLLDLENPPTALFVGNYHMALGALKAIAERKVVVPDQLSVITFDQLEFSFIMDPEISTIIQPQEEMGEKAALRLVQRMSGNTVNYPQVERLKTKKNFTDSIKMLQV